METKNGIYKYYYKSGELFNISEYNNDKLNGECICYYKNGNVLSNCNYINDKKHGKEYIYNINGFLYKSTDYNNDKIIEEIIHYENGNDVSTYNTIKKYYN